MIVEKLAILIDANVSGLTKGLADAAGAVETFAKETKKLAGDVAQAAGALTALGGVLVAQAAKYDREVAGAVKQLQNEFSALAIDIARVLLPVVRDMTAQLSRVVEFFRQLSPEAKAQVVQFAKITATVASAALAIQQLANLGDAVFGFTKYLLGISAPLLAIAAAAAAAAAAALFLRSAWEENLGGIRDLAKEAADTLKDSFSDAGSTIVNLFNAVGEAVTQGVLWPVEKVLQALAALSKTKVGAKLGMDANSFQAAADTVINMRKRGFDGVKEDITDSATKFADGVKKGADLFKKDVGGVLDEFKKILGMIPGAKSHDPGMTIDAQDALAGKPMFGPQVQSFDEMVGEVSEALAAMRDPLALTAEQLSQRFNVSVGAAAKALKSFQDAAKETAAAQRSSAGNAALGQLGSLGGVIQGAMSGGLAGAIVAIVAQAKSFGEMVGELNGLVEIVANFLNPLFEALRPFINVLGNVLRVLSPVFGLLLKLTPVFMVLQLALPIFFEVVKGLGIGILFVAQGVQFVWNAIVDAVEWMVRTIGNVLQFIPGVKDALDGFADAIHKMRDETDYAAERTKLMNMSLEDAKASIDSEKKSRDKLNESILNAPAGFKVAAARFGATDDGPPGLLGNSGVGRIQQASSGAQTINVYMDSRVVAEAVIDQGLVRNAKNFGARFALG